MKWDIAEFAAWLRRSDTASRDTAQTGAGMAMSGRAENTAVRSRSNGVPLLVRREILISDLKRMRATDPRRGRLNSEIRALTHQMLGLT